MGPFPHDAPKATISDINPAGTDGFEFVEYAHPDPAVLDRIFRQMGFAPVARHKTRDITLYRQGDINYLLNADAGTHAAGFVTEHGPCAPAMAWRVVDAQAALKRALDLGATEYTGPGKSIGAPAVYGIGGSLLYFIDKYGAEGSAYEADYAWLDEVNPRPGQVLRDGGERLRIDVDQGEFAARLREARGDSEAQAFGAASDGHTSPLR